MGSPCLFTHRQALKMGYSAAQIYANYAYAYYTSVFCVYAYVNTRTYTHIYVHICILPINESYHISSFRSLRKFTDKLPFINTCLIISYQK